MIDNLETDVTPLHLDLKGCSPMHYAVLIMREDLKMSYGQIGIKLNISYKAACELYKRARTNYKLKNND